MRHQLLAAALLAGGLALPAQAATLHPAVEAEAHSGSFADPMSVIVYLEEAPIARLNAELSEAGATRKERHRTIVNALQAQMSLQGPLKGWLEEEMVTGDVLGYTSYWITNCLVVQATKETILEIAQRPEVEAIEPNWKATPMEPILDPVDPQDELGSGLGMNRGSGFVPPGIHAVRAPEVWRDFGITGAGRIVANMDTGVDGNHPALASRWRGTTHPASESWLDVLGSSSFPSDGNGHGTHVMGTITGNSPTTQDTVGVAWGAQWIASNAINQGVGNEFDNDVITSFQWLMNPDGNPNTFDDVPDVVQNSWRINESFGGSYTDCDTRWWAAIDNCEAAGVVVTFSAGNEGPGSQTIGSPPDRATTAYNAFSVGAVDATNFNWPYPIANFSSRGPTGCNVSPELKIKPEIVAPGVQVYSSVPGGGYSSGYSGTSMAGPHVAGVVALIREANPNLSVDEVKQIIMETGRDLGSAGNDNTYGYGMIDAYAAIEASITGYGTLQGFVGNASFGNAPIPGATVTVIEDDRTFVTNAGGNYSGLVPAGTYTVEATHPSFTSQQFVVEVEASLVTVQNFSLTDIAGPMITNVNGPLTSSNEAGPYNVSATITDASTVTGARLYYRANGGVWQYVSMVGAGSYLGSIPGQNAGTQIDYYVWAEDGVGFTATEPSDAPTSFYSMYVTEVAYVYDVESQDNGWALSAPGDNASTGRWERVNPVGTTYDGQEIQPEDDHTPNPGVICFITGNTAPGGAAGDNDVDNGCTTLVSPTFDLADAELAFVSYARWFMMGGASADDVFNIDVSNDGGNSWVDLETVADFEPAWNEITLDVSAAVTLTSQVKFRFVACDINTQGLTEAGIDDFSLEVFVPGTTDVIESEGPVQRAVLEANAPNPMETVTTLRFRLSNTSEARLAIYDAGGRHVRTLVDGPLAAGSHQVAWDGRDAQGREVEAGVYFYRLEADAFSQSRRLLVVR